MNNRASLNGFPNRSRSGQSVNAADHTLRPVSAILLLTYWLAAFGFSAGCSREPTAQITERSVPQVVRVDASRAATVLAGSNVVVLDIRTPDEFAAGHLAGATNIDFQGADFQVRLAQLDRDQTYLLHCASGRRSQSSLSTFSALGFKSIIHLDGGIQAWKSAGLPVEGSP
jgi:rhodanese-related sulfurtransferase